MGTIQNALAGATSSIVNAKIASNIKKQKEADQLKAKAEAEEAEAVKKKQLDVDNEIKRKTMVDKGIAEGLDPTASIPQGTTVSGLIYSPFMQKIAMERQNILLMQRNKEKLAKAQAKAKHKFKRRGK